MDFHPYSYEISIFTLGAPHEEVQVTRQNITQTLQLFEAAEKNNEMMPLLRVLFLDTPGHPMSAPQYRNSSQYTIYAHTNQKFGHSLRPPFSEGVKEEHNF